MFFLGVMIYIAGGLGLYSLVESFTAVGLVVDSIYSWFFLGFGVQISVYAAICFGWSTACHLCWMVLFSSRSEVWVPDVSFQNVVYLFLRVLFFLFSTLLILGFVGVGVAKNQFSDVHQFFSILVPCLLLGGWVWSARDFFIAIASFSKGKFV